MTAKTILTAALALSMVTLLSGCLDRGEGESSPEFLSSIGEKFIKASGIDDAKMDYVFWPGVSLVIDQEVVKVYGKEDCPQVERSAFWIALFGPNDPPQTNCFIVTPGTVAVDVLYPKNGALTDERWTVDRRQYHGHNAVRLLRPNGDSVYSSDARSSVEPATLSVADKQSVGEEYRSF